MNRRGFFAMIPAAIASVAVAPKLKALVEPQKIGKPISLRRPYSHKEVADALSFYMGKQWPEEEQELRLRQGRPCLVINRIPEFFAKAVAIEGESDNDRLLVDVVRRHRDEQMMYNYMASTNLELANHRCISTTSA